MFGSGIDNSDCTAIIVSFKPFPWYALLERKDDHINWSMGNIRIEGNHCQLLNAIKRAVKMVVYELSPQHGKCIAISILRNVSAAPVTCSHVSTWDPQHLHLSAARATDLGPSPFLRFVLEAELGYLKKAIINVVAKDRSRNIKGRYPVLVVTAASGRSSRSYLSLIPARMSKPSSVAKNTVAGYALHVY